MAKLSRITFRVAPSLHWKKSGPFLTLEKEWAQGQSPSPPSLHWLCSLLILLLHVRHLLYKNQCVCVSVSVCTRVRRRRRRMPLIEMTVGPALYILFIFFLYSLYILWCTYKCYMYIIYRHRYRYTCRHWYRYRHEWKCLVFFLSLLAVLFKSIGNRLSGLGFRISMSYLFLESCAVSFKGIAYRFSDTI